MTDNTDQLRVYVLSVFARRLSAVSKVVSHAVENNEKELLAFAIAQLHIWLDNVAGDTAVCAMDWERDAFMRIKLHVDDLKEKYTEAMQRVGWDEDREQEQYLRLCERLGHDPLDF